MVPDPTPPPRGGVVASGNPRLVFDADCGFCTASAGWIGARLPAEIEVSGWQTLDLASLNLTEAQVSSAAYWLDAHGRAHRGHLAVARALAATSGPWRPVGLLLLVPPIRWLAAVGYRIVARFRHRLPGATETCAAGPHRQQ